MTYLDANATEPLRPAARAAMAAAWDSVGNPSSVHGPGRAARRILEQARERIAARLGAAPARLVVVSGGTEGNAAALHALGAGRRLVVLATEHDSVGRNAPGAEILPVERTGLVDPDRLSALLRGGGPALLCAMLANNETGVIQPVAALAGICRRHGALLHVDAVQAAGRLPVAMGALEADSLCVSSHKLGGPAGCGVLVLAGDPPPRPLIGGGGQEGGWRGGTQPVALLAGFAAALEAERVPLEGLRDAIEAQAVAAGATVVAAGVERLGNTACLALPGVPAQTQVIALDLAGVAVSAGSACSSGKVARSHVLQAMGLGELAGQAIRVSLPWNAGPADVAAFGAAYAAMAGRLARRAA